MNCKKLVNTLKFKSKNEGKKEEEKLRFFGLLGYDTASLGK
jgi:hypothetical protein